MLSATLFRRRAWLSRLSVLALGLAALQAAPIPAVDGVGNFHQVNRAPDDTQIAAVLALLNDGSQWPVFVHCRRGADRTGTAIACYRIMHDHWSKQQALAEAKTFGMSSLEVAMQRYILNFKGLNFQTPVTASNTTPDVNPALSVSAAQQPAP